MDRTDLYGQSLLDWVHQGGSVYITFTCMTFQAGSTLIKNVFYPWGPMGRLLDTITPRQIGRLASSVAQLLLLTAVLGTPAATTGPATLSASKAILPPGSNQRLMFSSRVRKVPCKLALLPYEPSPGLGLGAGTVVWWTET